MVFLPLLYMVCLANILKLIAVGPIEQQFLSIQVQSALIAQLVERVTSNDEVAGSTPS